jgi:hypothetical protein
MNETGRPVKPAISPYATADSRLGALIDGASTVEDIAQRLAADADKLAWLRIDLRHGDLACTLRRVRPDVSAADVVAAYQAVIQTSARRSSAAYYAAQTREDDRASLERAAPRRISDDD